MLTVILDHHLNHPSSFLLHCHNKGHLSLACDTKGIKEECKKTLLTWLVSRMNFYGPFIQE